MLWACRLVQYRVSTWNSPQAHAHRAKSHMLLAFITVDELFEIISISWHNNDITAFNVIIFRFYMPVFRWDVLWHGATYKYKLHFIIISYKIYWAISVVAAENRHRSSLNMRVITKCFTGGRQAYVAVSDCLCFILVLCWWWPYHSLLCGANS